MREVKRAHEVQIDATAPILERSLEKLLGGRASGIRHADIDAPEALRGLGDEAAHLLVNRDVNRVREYLDAG